MGRPGHHSSVLPVSFPGTQKHVRRNGGRGRVNRVQTQLMKPYSYPQRWTTLIKRYSTLPLGLALSIVSERSLNRRFAVKSLQRATS